MHYVQFLHVSQLNTKIHGRKNCKDTKPYMSAFLSVDLLTEFAAFCLKVHKREKFFVSDFELFTIL
jgi:hypothetical protein